MNRGGSSIHTGALNDIGLTYEPVTIATTTAPPRAGYISRLKVEITGGPGTLVRARIVEPVTSRVVCEYDDPTTPGDPILAPLHFADTELWYNRGGSAFLVEVATDDATGLTDVSVEVEVRHAR